MLRTLLLLPDALPIMIVAQLLVDCHCLLELIDQDVLGQVQLAQLESLHALVLASPVVEVPLESVCVANLEILLKDGDHQVADLQLTRLPLRVLNPRRYLRVDLGQRPNHVRVDQPRRRQVCLVTVSLAVSDACPPRKCLHLFHREPRLHAPHGHLNLSPDDAPPLNLTV